MYTIRMVSKTDANVKIALINSDRIGELMLSKRPAFKH